MSIAVYSDVGVRVAVYLDAFRDRPPLLEELLRAIPGARPTAAWDAKAARFEVAA